MTEHPLDGGNVAAGVVRVGDTVRKPAGFWTPAVDALLAELPPLIGAHTRGMADLLDNGARTGTQPWARLQAGGHGEHWTAAAEYIEHNLPAWRQALR
jgi:hypothetical protein